MTAVNDLALHPNYHCYPISSCITPQFKFISLMYLSYPHDHIYDSRNLYRDHVM